MFVIPYICRLFEHTQLVACVQTLEGDFMQGGDLSQVISTFRDVKCTELVSRDEDDEEGDDTRQFNMDARYLPHMRAMVLTSNLSTSFECMGTSCRACLYRGHIHICICIPTLTLCVLVIILAHVLCV